MAHTTLMSADRLPRLLSHIEERGLELDVYPVHDIPGPGGGVYIKHQTPLTAKHARWLANRSPSRTQPTFVEVRCVHRTKGEVAPLEIEEVPEEEAGRGEAMANKARRHARRVAEAAEEVAGAASEIYRSLGKADFTVADLRREDTRKSLQQFEAGFLKLHDAVRGALDDYLQGNTLIMDLILRYELDQETVRHALSVAGFATEMASLLAFRHEEDDDLKGYFGEATDDELFAASGEPPPEGGRTPAPDRPSRRRALFREELVEIFLGGFLHDCGLWTEPYFPPEGHEVKGAALICEAPEVVAQAPSLANIVLFHSDVARLARKHGVVKVTQSPTDPRRTSYRRAFYDDVEKAVAAAREDPAADVLSSADLRKVTPVALAEHYVSQTCDLYTKPEGEVISDLAGYSQGGLFERYVLVLCNSRVEVVAPRRALVRLGGHVTVMVARRTGSRRAVRLQVDGYDAGSLYHGTDRNSPHLITLLIRRSDGSRVKAKYVPSTDSLLWERATSLDHRIYIAGGRFRNSLTYRVTGFMSEALFDRVLGEYERVFDQRRQ